MSATNELDRLGLTGRTVRQVFVGPEESYMILRTDEGDLTWATDADCCSETWFADVVGFANLVDAPIVAATEFEPPEVDDGRTRQESDSFYGLRVTTLSGECEVIWRNSSNGYYGGSIWLVGDNPESNEYRYYSDRPDVKAEDLCEITADWRAPVPMRPE